MKLIVFEATGRTGQYLVPQALAAGYEITALVRTPSKLVIDDENLTVLQGDVTNPDQVLKAMAGGEAVLSVLGPTSNKPDYMVSQGMAHIIAAMNEHGIKRLVVSAGAGVADANDEPKFFNKFFGFLIRTFSRYVYEDMVRTVDVVRASDLDWTIVRLPRLTDDPPTGKVKAAYVGKGMGMQVGRADVAAFMLEQVESDAYLHQAPAISSGW